MASRVEQLYAEFKELAERSRRVEEEYRIQDAVEEALKAVLNERSVFDGYDPQGYIGCYEADMKLRGVSEDRMIVNFEKLVIPDLSKQIQRFAKEFANNWDDFAKAVVQEGLDYLDLEIKGILVDVTSEDRIDEKKTSADMVSDLDDISGLCEDANKNACHEVPTIQGSKNLGCLQVCEQYLRHKRDLGLVSHGIFCKQVCEHLYIMDWKGAQGDDLKQEEDEKLMSILDNGFMRNGDALHMFWRRVYMRHPYDPGGGSVACSLKSCGSMGATDKGQEIHVMAARQGLLEKDDVVVGTTLVDMYAKCGEVAKARQVLEGVSIFDVYAWSALIAGYVQQGKGEEVLNCFSLMQDKGVSPNAVTFGCFLKACISKRDISVGRELYHLIMKSNLKQDAFLCSHLIWMFGVCGSLPNAQYLFRQHPRPGVYIWNAIISAHTKLWHYFQALELYLHMHQHPDIPDGYLFVTVLHACNGIQNLTYSEFIHAHVLETSAEASVFVGSALISRCAEGGYKDHALGLFEEMQLEDVFPNIDMFIWCLKASSSMGAMNIGQLVHARIEKQGFLKEDIQIGGALVDMYMKCGLLEVAKHVFDKFHVASWTAPIARYVEHGHSKDALKGFEQMQLESGFLNIVPSLRACGNIAAADKGGQIHAEIGRQGLFETDLIIGNSLVDMYIKSGAPAMARQVFTKISIRDVISWNALIAGYAEHGLGEVALSCFRQMQDESVHPDAITLMCIVKTCISIRSISRVWEFLMEPECKGLLESDLFVGSALVDMCVKCGSFTIARQIFDMLSFCDGVLWTSLIAGYCEHAYGEKPLSCFDQMHTEGITYVCIVKACSSIGDICKGQDLYVEILTKGFLAGNLIVGTPLIDMCVSCDVFAKALEAFDGLPARNEVPWTALIAGYVKNGHCEEALDRFEQMLHEGVSPNAVTYVCGLKAYGNIGDSYRGKEFHAEVERLGILEKHLGVGSTLIAMYANCGMLEKAQQLFDNFEILSNGYGVVLTLEHHTYMVDLFGHAGYLDKAATFIKEIPLSANVELWHTLLGTYRKWGGMWSLGEVL